MTNVINVDIDSLKDKLDEMKEASFATVEMCVEEYELHLAAVDIENDSTVSFGSVDYIDDYDV